MNLYELANTKELNEKHPDTFEIPTTKGVASLKLGDYVKLIFLNDKGEGERMWVKILDIKEGNYVGELNNDPVLTPIKIGEIVKFKAENIASIY